MRPLKETLPPDQLPRERLKQFGADKLSDIELLAIILRTGSKGNSVLQVSAELINRFRNLSLLSTRSIEELKQIPGIGQDKAITLKAVFEIATRVHKSVMYTEEWKVTSPDIVAEFFIPMLKNKQKEVFMIACLNAANVLMNYRTITEGILDASLVHPREVFKAALEESAKSIVLIHNHPSGNCNPSPHDIVITNKLVEAGRVFEIPVLDHLIIAGNNFTSLMELNVVKFGSNKNDSA